MPQLDFATFPSQLFWLTVSFVALYLVMAYVGLPRLRGILSQRHERRERDLARVARLKDEAASIVASYERALGEARAKAQMTMREATRRCAVGISERQKKLEDDLAAECARAEAQIAETKHAALTNLRDVAVDVACALALKIRGAELDAARARAAVDAMLKERMEWSS